MKTLLLLVAITQFSCFHCITHCNSFSRLDNYAAPTQMVKPVFAKSFRLFQMNYVLKNHKDNLRIREYLFVSCSTAGLYVASLSA